MRQRHNSNRHGLTRGTVVALVALLGLVVIGFFALRGSDTPAVAPAPQAVSSTSPAMPNNASAVSPSGVPDKKAPPWARHRPMAQPQNP